MTFFTIQDLDVKLDGNQNFFIGNKRIVLLEWKSSGLTIPLEFWGKGDNKDMSLQFSCQEEKNAFLYARANCITSMDDIQRYMNEFYENKRVSAQILDAVKGNHFFAQLQGVDLRKTTKAKLYGDKIYMNGVQVVLNEEEKMVFHGILDEADRHFANWEDQDVTSISNSLIITRVFKHYFPNYQDVPNRFWVTVPVCFSQIHS